MAAPSRRGAMCLLLGGWLLGTIVVGFVAAENFFLIDRLLASPAAHSAFHRDIAQLDASLGAEEGRILLRYLSSEMNRFYFRVWGGVEALLGIVLLLLAARSREKRLVIGFSLMLTLVAATELFLTPQIVSVGRALDFVPRHPAPPNLATFGMLHGAYSTVDLIKLLVGFWMAWLLIRSTAKRDAGRTGRL
jgi:hypothetical protein